MKKSQFASLHAGMLTRSSAPMAARAIRSDEASPADAVPTDATTSAAPAASPVWRSDEPVSFDSWEHLRAELLPPGWGRSSGAATDAAMPALVDVADDQASPEVATTPRAEFATAEVARPTGEADGRQLRQRGGFGRRATPPPSSSDAGNDDNPDWEAGDPPSDANEPADAADEPTTGAIVPSHGDGDTELEIPSFLAPVDTAFADLDVPSRSTPAEDANSFGAAPGGAETADGDQAAGAIHGYDDGLTTAVPVDHVPTDFDPAHDIDDDGDHEGLVEADHDDAAEPTTPPALVAGRRKAMTVRLDPPRHRRLRLAGVYYGRSCQDMMVSALDTYLAQLGFGAESET